MDPVPPPTPTPTPSRCLRVATMFGALKAVGVAATAGGSGLESAPPHIMLVTLALAPMAAPRPLSCPIFCGEEPWV